mgnify:CR=1 FL=1
MTGYDVFAIVVILFSVAAGWVRGGVREIITLLSAILALAAFAAGFAVRPFGALVFGRLGDMVGRKYTFLVTVTLMGIATAGVGLIRKFAHNMAFRRRDPQRRWDRPLPMADYVTIQRWLADLPVAVAARSTSAGLFPSSAADRAARDAGADLRHLHQAVPQPSAVDP